MPTSTDILIIGAGAAGLAAAHHLCAAGRHVTLLEARNRLGGRIDTLHLPDWPVPLERGAEFLHGKPPETWALAHAANATIYDVAQTHAVFQRGRVAQRNDFYDRVGRVLGILQKARHDMSFDDCLRQFARRLDPNAKRWARLYVQDFNAADAAIISCHWLREAQQAAEKISGDRLFRLLTGYDAIIRHLRDACGNKLQIELNTTVREIHWNNASIHVNAEASDGKTTRPRTFHADKLILTVPIAILQAPPDAPGAIRFDPPLPAPYLRAISQIRMGNVIKVLLRFHADPAEKTLGNLNFIHDTPHFPTWWRTIPLRTPVFTGWSAGPAADPLINMSDDELVTRALTSLAQALGTSPRHLRQNLAAAHVANWARDPYARGAYSYAAVGGTRACRQLARPLARQLFIAGEATHPGQSGTVAGALITGTRAAQQVLLTN